MRRREDLKSIDPSNQPINHTLQTTSNSMKSTHNAGLNKRVLKVRVPLQQLVAEERCVLEIGVECDVDRQVWREVRQVQGLESCHFGVGESVMMMMGDARCSNWTGRKYHLLELGVL